MIKLQINDANFSHNKTGTTSVCFESKNIKWLRGLEQTDPVVLTDLYIYQIGSPIFKGRKVIAWILEPEVIDPRAYQFIRQYHQMFYHVFSHNMDLVKSVPNSTYVPYGSSWIEEKYWVDEPNKTKSISLIASEKRSTSGHILRHEIASNVNKNEVDLYGRAYKFVESKAEALSDYRFSIIIENCLCAGYFTEKLIDAFATKTIPIYWGDPNISSLFNPKGIIISNTYEEIMKNIDIIRTNGEAIYAAAKPAIDLNFELAKSYRTAEDQLYMHLMSKFS